MPSYSFTASYGKTLNSFTIIGVPDGATADALVRSFTCIIRNILSRSDRTMPSSRLASILSPLPDLHEEESVSIINKGADLPHWESTIKGSEDGRNPARDFFYNDRLWNQYLPDFRWVRQLVIPEAPLARILQDTSGQWAEQCVDFYLAAANLVIEIDGAQHLNDPKQVKLDQIRDLALRKANATVVRIPVSSLLAEDDIFAQAMRQISQTISSSPIIKSYTLLDAKRSDHLLRLRYDVVLRFQFLLMQLIENRTLDLRASSWSFNINSEDRELFQAAASDLLAWYGDLFSLHNLSFTPPRVQFCDDKKSLKIRQSLWERPDETPHECITILTDLWDGYSYYRVSCAEPVDYQIPWPLPISSSQGEALQHLLKEIFDFDVFREGQWEIISSFLNRRRTIGILPTGGGKSLCYQLAALLQPAISFVVCPTVSLLIDQKKNLDSVWDRTGYICSESTPKERRDFYDHFQNSSFQLVWVSPERFQSHEFRDALSLLAGNHRLDFAVIDEVHCLSEWGHDFRPSYLALVDEIERLCPDAILVGLTATASQAVLTDLKIEMQIGSEGIRALPSLERNNLSFEVIKTDDQGSALINLLKEHGYGDPSCKPECGIVFTSTRDESENPESYSRNKLARDIRKAFPCNLNEIGIYHAGVSDKQQVQKDFIDGKLKLLSATKAFGIGVNKTDIQFTIHRQLPWSIESFYQEAGRAGRAGQSAHCYILFAPKQLGSKQAIQTVFAPDATPEEIATSGVQGDLRTLFYLWGQNNKGIDAEVGYIQELRNRLNVSYRKRRSDSQDYCTIYADRAPKKGDSAPNGYVILTKDDLELALYHLKLLGVVNDWLVDWRNNSFDVFPGSRDPESVSAHLFQYIRRHDAAFANPWRDVDLKYKRILESQTENYINSHARALIAWTYDHIVYSRREAIKNMLDFCNEYRDPVSFRKRIDNFLRIPEQSVLLDGIIGNPHNWHMWFQLLQREEHLSPLKTVINPLRMHELKNLGDVIRRYRESYQENTGLNLIYALSSAFCSEMDSNTELLLGNALQSIVSEGPLQNSCFFIFNEILARCVTYLPYTDLQSRSSIARQLLRFYPQKARDINRTLHDPVSYSALLITATEKIHHAMGGIL